MLERYPRVKLQLTEVSSAAEYTELLERRVDIRFSLLVKPLEKKMAKDFNSEISTTTASASPSVRKARGRAGEGSIWRN